MSRFANFYSLKEKTNTLILHLTIRSNLNDEWYETYSNLSILLIKHSPIANEKSNTYSFFIKK